MQISLYLLLKIQFPGIFLVEKCSDPVRAEGGVRGWGGKGEFVRGENRQK